MKLHRKFSKKQKISKLKNEEKETQIQNLEEGEKKKNDQKGKAKERQKKHRQSRKDLQQNVLKDCNEFDFSFTEKMSKERNNGRRQ